MRSRGVPEPTWFQLRMTERCCFDAGPDDDIYIADFLGNAVHRVCAKTGKVTTIAKNENTFKLLSEVLSSDFQVVSADGDIIGRTDLLQEIIKSYNTYEKGDLTVDINNFRLIRSGKTCLMTYKEWQRIESTTTARIATVVFRRLKEFRLEWVHVHETWVPGTNLRSEGATFGD